MKKITYLFVSLLILLNISCCKTNNYEKEFYLYQANSTSNLFEDYFNIEDTSTKVFTSKDDFKKFNNLLDDQFVSSNDKFNLDINFNVNYVAITAIYCDNYLANINLNNIEYNDNNININFTIEKTTNSIDTSTYAFLYIVLDKNINYEFKVNAIEYYDGSSGIEPNEEHNWYVCYKPVVYFYPTQNMKLDIKYINESKLLTTYPKYNNLWSLNLNIDGTFTTNNSNRQYYALYYDELYDYNIEFNEGFYVTSENAINFLEEKLDILGYTQREANEFIMYWLPTLENNKKSIVYFETTEERNNECPLEFSVEPDSILRTIIHIKKVEEEINIKEQVLPTFNRQGFSVVEWGGVSY